MDFPSFYKHTHVIMLKASQPKLSVTNCRVTALVSYTGGTKTNVVDISMIWRFWELNMGQRRGHPFLLSHIPEVINTSGTVRAQCMGASPTESSGIEFLIKFLGHY